MDHDYTNPWPYMEKYFKLSSWKGRNLYFQCQMCLPAKKIISCSEKSRSGWKSHIQHVHTFCYNSFKACLAEGSKSRSKKRCVEELQEPEGAGIVDLTFRITTCRSLLAIAFRT